ncbi:MAG: AraC family transcriptional regulator [Lachnospiraceae bacterium]
MDYTHIPEVSCFYSNSNDSILAIPDAHYEYQIILVIGGTSKVVINHKTYELKPKSLIFISRMERHYFIVEEEPYERMVASMSSDLIMSNIKEPELLSLFIQRPKQFSHVINLSDAAYDMLYPLFVRLCNEYKEDRLFYVSRAVSIVVAILIDMYRMHPDYFPPRCQNNLTEAVLNTQRFINDHYNENFTLQQIADSNYISRHALSIAFKEIVGITFKEYLLLFRIAEAKRLLVTTDLSIYDIAEQVGYINVNNFIKIFKEREDQTPLKYRKQFLSSN